MARQNPRLRFADAAEAQRVGRIAPGGRDALFAQVRQAGKIINPRAANDPYDCFGHAHPAPPRAAPVLTVAAPRIAPLLMSLALVRGFPDPLLDVIEQHREHDEEDQDPETNSLALGEVRFGGPAQ